MERNKPKYRIPLYKALPKGWSFSHDGLFSERWENWKCRQVEGSYVTYYTYHPYIMDDKGYEEYENSARKHFIHCEDGHADYNMPSHFHMVEIDPETLRQETGIEYEFDWTGTNGKTRKYKAILWEYDIVEFEAVIQACKPTLKGVGEIIWNNNRWEIKPLLFHKDEECGFYEETPVKGDVSLGFRVEDFVNNYVTKVYGTKFELEHHVDIWKNSPDKDPFRRLVL